MLIFNIIYRDLEIKRVERIRKEVNSCNCYTVCPVGHEGKEPLYFSNQH